MTEFHSYLKTDANGILWFDGVSVPELAETYGTPLFVLSESTIRENYRKIHGAFAAHYPGDFDICVGMKGNWGMAARRVVVSEGAGTEAFGLGELTIALMAGADPARMVMNGPNKTDEMLTAAIEAGVLIQVDNLDELDNTNRVAESLNKQARVAPRVRLPLNNIADVTYTDTRYQDGINPALWERAFKFGMEPREFHIAVERALAMAHISLEGLMYHGGIPRRAGLHREETEDFIDHVAQIKAAFGWEPKYINVGGGFVPPRVGCEIPCSIDDYAKGITEAIVGRCEAHGLTLPTLLCEPGRFCWESAGLWIVRAGNVKTDEDLTQQTWVYVDGSINEMGDPFDPHSSWHHVVIANDADRAGTATVDICGQLCNAQDILAKSREMAPISGGDILAFLDMGAYNEAFANQSNAMPRSATVMVSDGRHTVVRRRETVQDVIARDSVPSWLLAR